MMMMMMIGKICVQIFHKIELNKYKIEYLNDSDNHAERYGKRTLNDTNIVAIGRAENGKNQNDDIENYHVNKCHKRGD